MSDADDHATDILLPAAKVIVFSRDEETLNSAKSLGDDWRFSRVEMRVIEGDVDSAAALFAQEGRSPDLVIIQTDDIEDGFTDQLGGLSEYCDEGTAAVIIGPVNDVYLYRRLIDMGVSDYLVRPVTSDVLGDVVAKTLITKLGVSGSHLIAFIGAKGGVGTTTLTQAAALLASSTLDQKVMLMDVAGGSSALSVGLGFDPASTLPDLVRMIEADNDDSLKRMLFQYNEKMTVVAGGSDAILDPPISGEQLEKVINKFMVKCPVVFVDVSCAAAPLKKMVMMRANRIVIVTSPTVTSLRFARSLLKEIADVRGGKDDSISLLVNMQGMAKAHEVSSSDIEAALEFKSSASIPFLPAAFLDAESDSEKLVTDRDMSSALRSSLLPILKETLAVDGHETGEDDKKSGFIGGFLTKLTSK